MTTKDKLIAAVSVLTEADIDAILAYLSAIGQR